MKVLIHYEDNEDTELWKSLKITLPKSWKTGPTHKLLGQFVESYNNIEKLGGGPNPLKESELHLAIRQQKSNYDPTTEIVALASDAVVIDVIPDRADVYVLHGPSQTLAEISAAKAAALKQKKEQQGSNVQCTRFGCQNRFPKGGPYPSKCVYHKSPPVFHETAKFWSCCPDKKAYDWEDFQNIPGCCTAPQCTEVKDEAAQNTKQFLGGCDLRAGDTDGTGSKLKSIDDFNRAEAAGGADAAPVLDRLRNVLVELGIEKELYYQVVEGIKGKIQKEGNISDDAELLQAVAAQVGNIIKTTLKKEAAEQLRIK